MSDYLEADVLIIGNGIGGCSAALSLAEEGLNIIIISKGASPEKNNTFYAQGGIAALADEDRKEDFVNDILKAGDHLNFPEAVELVVEQSRDLINEIMIKKLKINFSRNGEKFDLAKEGGHSRRRVFNVKDMTGKVIQESFLAYLKQFNNIRMLYSHTAIDLLTYPHHSINPLRIYHEPKVIGAYVLNQLNGKVIRIFARKVILATGGLSSVFLHSTNPAEAVGNGIAMAYRAGARIINLEYVQFHPTALYNKEGETFLISEAVRGEGARLMNRNREYFMERYSPQKDLAPRDLVARAIYEEMIRYGDEYVLLDLCSFAKIDIKSRFPTIYEKCLEFGIDITQKPIPVVPAAHYSCGGVWVNLEAKSSIKNLYAVGEVACTGVHGANRLASVSLLEGLVFGVLCARNIIKTINNEKEPYLISEIPAWKFPTNQEKIDPALIWQDLITIRYIMWNYCGIIRNIKRMERAKSDLDYLKHRIIKFYQSSEMDDRIITLRDSVQTALLVVSSALRNKISRGSHYIEN